METSKIETQGITSEKAKNMYQKMCEIRHFEDTVHEVFGKALSLVLYIFMLVKKQ